MKKKSMLNFGDKITLIIMFLALLGIIGEIMCVIKFATSDFKPSYKREIIYGVGMITGTGALIGWFNIQDSEN